jgi:hypothetical protein
MAGLGKKTFNAGDVLTASDVQGYLADQTIMVFASSSARTTALPSPSEGMFSYLSDSNTSWVYDGSAWVSAYGKQVIATNSLSTATSTSFSAIPAYYRDLEIRLQFTTIITNPATPVMTVNSTGGTIYSWTSSYYSSAAATSTSAPSFSHGSKQASITFTNTPASGNGSYVISIQNYAGSQNSKLGNFNFGSSYTGNTTGFGAIAIDLSGAFTSIQFTFTGQVTGSATLYGVF